MSHLICAIMYFGYRMRSKIFDEIVLTQIKSNENYVKPVINHVRDDARMDFIFGISVSPILYHYPPLLTTRFSLCRPLLFILKLQSNV